MTHLYRHAQALRQLRDVEICKQLQARRHPSDIYLTVKLVDKVKHNPNSQWSYNCHI